MRTPKRAPLLAAIFTFVALLFACAPEAQAQPRILRPSTRPMFFTGGVGTEFFGLNDSNYGVAGRFGYIQRFKVGLDFGYHFSGDGEGPAIGASIEQTFGGRFSYMFNPTFKFWWDIEIADMAIYIAPFAKAGYAMMTRPRYCRSFAPGRRCGMGHFANIGIGAEGRVVLNDRGMLFLRPIQVDTYLGPDDFYGEVFIIGYTLMLGGGVTF